MIKSLEKVLSLYDAGRYIEAFNLLNSLRLNIYDEFNFVIDKVIRIGKVKHEVRRSMLDIYFIDIYDDNIGCHFYRPQGKLFVISGNEVTNEKDIRKYFSPIVIKTLRDIIHNNRKENNYETDK